MVTTEELIELAKEKSKKLGKYPGRVKRAKLTEQLKKQGRKKFFASKAKAVPKKAYGGAKKAARVGKREIIALGKKKKKAFEKRVYGKGVTKKEMPFVKSIKRALRKKKSRVVARYRRAQRPVRRRVIRRPVPPQFRRQQVQRIPVTRQPMTITSVRQLQGAPPHVLAKMLSESEIVEINRIMPAARRAAAIQMISRRLKEKERARQIANPIVRVERDLMAGKEIIRREVPREAWSQ